MFLKLLLFFIIAFCGSIVVYTFYLLSGVPLTMPLLLLSLSIIVISKLVSRRVTSKVDKLKLLLTTASDKERIDINGEIYATKFPQRVFNVLVIVAALFAYPYFMFGQYEQLIIFGFHLDCLTFIIIMTLLHLGVHYLKKWLNKTNNK